VQAFLNGTGSLLYLWDRDEALHLITSIYHPKGDLDKADAAEVFAMSTVGSYCDGDTQSIEVQETFLHNLLYLVSSPLDISDHRYMRLFACLSICRFMSSVESTRRLMCKQLMLSMSSYDELTSRSICA
jgi:hypothetical protein